VLEPGSRWASIWAEQDEPTERRGGEG
jgi:hypothetical protein